MSAGILFNKKKTSGLSFHNLSFPFKFLNSHLKLEFAHMAVHFRIESCVCVLWMNLHARVFKFHMHFLFFDASYL